MLGLTADTSSSVAVLWRCLFQFIVKVVDTAVMLQRQVRTVSNCARSSTTLSWRRGRFLWCCAADHRDFPVAVHSRGVRCPSCASPAVRVHAVRRQSRSHSCSPFFWTLSFARPLCATKVAWSMLWRSSSTVLRPCDHGATFAQWKCPRFSFRR